MARSALTSDNVLTWKSQMHLFDELTLGWLSFGQQSLDQTHYSSVINSPLLRNKELTKLNAWQEYSETQTFIDHILGGQEVLPKPSAQTTKILSITKQKAYRSRYSNNLSQYLTKVEEKDADWVPNVKLESSDEESEDDLVENNFRMPRMVEPVQKLTELNTWQENVKLESSDDEYEDDLVEDNFRVPRMLEPVQKHECAEQFAKLLIKPSTIDKSCVVLRPLMKANQYKKRNHKSFPSSYAEQPASCVHSSARQEVSCADDKKFDFERRNMANSLVASPKLYLESPTHSVTLQNKRRREDQEWDTKSNKVARLETTTQSPLATSVDCFNFISQKPVNSSQSPIKVPRLADARKRYEERRAAQSDSGSKVKLSSRFGLAATNQYRSCLIPPKSDENNNASPSYSYCRQSTKKPLVELQSKTECYQQSPTMQISKTAEEKHVVDLTKGGNAPRQLRITEFFKR